MLTLYFMYFFCSLSINCSFLVEKMWLFFTSKFCTKKKVLMHVFTFFFFAFSISGSMGTTEWQVEGRRLVPLMPRLVPQTAFTSTANQAASAMMEKNATLPPPSSTCNRDGRQNEQTFKLREKDTRF